jgi:hypothetical protein
MLTFGSMGRKAREDRSTVTSFQLGLRLTGSEVQLMRTLVALAEDRAGLTHGSISPATYCRSGLLQWMHTRAIAEGLESSKASASDAPTGPTTAPKTKITADGRVVAEWAEPTMKVLKGGVPYDALEPSARVPSPEEQQKRDRRIGREPAGKRTKEGRTP